MIIDFSEVLEGQRKAAEMVRNAQAADSSAEAAKLYKEAYGVMERLALPLTGYGILSKPHPDLGEAHFGLWIMAAGVAIQAGYMSNAAFCAKMADASGPVDSDYELLCDVKKGAAESMEKSARAIPPAADDIGAIMRLAEKKIVNQIFSTPTASLEEYPPILDANENHVLRIRKEVFGDGEPGQNHQGAEREYDEKIARLEGVIESLKARNAIMEGELAAFRDVLEKMSEERKPEHRDFGDEPGQ